MAIAAHGSGSLKGVGLRAVACGPPARANWPQHHASPTPHNQTLWNFPRHT